MRWIPVILTACVLALLSFLIFNKKVDVPVADVDTEEREKRKAAKASFVIDRLKYEYDMIKDPETGQLPENIFEREKQFAKKLPVKTSGLVNGRVNVLNNYLPAGPNNIGGRTRAVAYDVRFNGTTNRVIISGCVSGGIMRSTNGGNTWTLVTPQNDIHSFTALAQDPRPGFQDTWYAGGGEAFGNSASDIGAFYFGHGIWKSTDNGASWNKLTLTVTNLNGTLINSGALEAFDHPFDIVHRIQVNPINGDVYIAGQATIIRSQNGGSSFNIVFGTLGGNNATGQMDVLVSNAGRVMVAVNGGLPTATLRGVWISQTGNANSFNRIAGGQTLGVDSVENWRANVYTNSGSKRILLAQAPSNNDIVYVFYENGLSNSSPDYKPEGDLFRLNINSNTYTWSNRSQNLPDYPNGNVTGSDPLDLQGGYNMLIKVFPTDPNIVFVGGTNLYRSTDGFSTNNTLAWINGYRSVPARYELYPNGHPDIHELVFNPSNAQESICGNDGGIQITPNILAGSGSFLVTPVTWNMVPNYQTVQYYYVAMDPDAGSNNFIGGAQDNSTLFRDRVGILKTQAQDSNNHIYLIGGDGTSVGISRTNFVAQAQYLYGGSQRGYIRRIRISNSVPTPSIFGEDIKPTGLTTVSTTVTDEFGEFVTNFKLDPDNTEDLYYVNFNRLFRTTSASSVAAGGWVELTGVSQAVNPGNPTSGRDVSIRALAFTRGPYSSQNALYFGTTNGNIFRLDDPRNASGSTAPVNINPPGIKGNVQNIAVNPNNDSEIIAVVTNYGEVSIWWTTNAKSPNPTWVNAEGNLTLPSVRSCAIVVKKDANNTPVTEYYVGTSIGLYSTISINGGSTVWQREGAAILNYAVIQSIAYRPVDNVMVLGTHGNGMYFTYIGTPNFVPQTPTPVTTITNDKNFIKATFPTIASNKVQFETGNLIGIKSIQITVTDMSGKVVYNKVEPYRNGNIPVHVLSPGTYILNLQSDNNRFRHVQKIVKQ